MDPKEELDQIVKCGKKAFNECIEFYPKHLNIVGNLWKNYIDIFYLMDSSKNLKRFHDYLWNFSNFIAKKYFPDEINEDWRRPCMLELSIYEIMFKGLNRAIDEDSKFREHLIQSLQTDPLIKDNPVAHLFEGLIAGGGFVSTIEIAEALDIPHDSMLKQTQKLIDQKILKPRRDYYQTKIEDF